MNYQMPSKRAPKIRYCIGIDPDKDKSGFACFDRMENCFERFGPYEALPLIRACTSKKVEECEFFVEAGWNNKGMNDYQLKNMPAGFDRWPALRQWAFWFDRGTDVGINFGAGHMIIALLKGLGYTVHEYTPHTTKWDAKYLKLYTRITDRTNQDTRDAIRAAFLNR